MKEISRFLTSSLILAAAACGGPDMGDGANNPDGFFPTSPSNPSNPTNSSNPANPNPSPDTSRQPICGVVFDKATMQKAGVTLPYVNGDYIVSAPAGIETCDSYTEVNGARTSVHLEGYSTLYVYKRAEVLGNFTAAEATNSPASTLKLKFATQSKMSDEGKKALAHSLHALMDHYSPSSLNLLSTVSMSTTWVVFSNGLTSKARSYTTNQANESEYSIEVPLSQSASDLARQLNNGGLSVKLYSGTTSYFNNPYLLESTFSSNAGTVTDSIGLGSSAKLILSLWNNAVSRPEQLQVFNETLSLLRQFPVTNPKQTLAPLYLAADGEWATVPNNFGSLEWSVATLRFLNAVDANHPTKRIYEIYNRLSSSSLGNRALSESVWLDRNSGLSATEQEVLLSTFVLYEQGQLPYPNRWAQAKLMAKSAQYNFTVVQDSFGRLKKVYDWLRSYSGANLDPQTALSKASDYVTQRNVTETQLSTLEHQFDWLQSYAGANISDKTKALTEAEALTFAPNITTAQLALLPTIFDWLQSYSGANISDKSAAYARAKSFTLDKNISPAQFTLLKTTFDWLQSYSGANISDKAKALTSAENYVLTQGLVSLDLLTKAFDWLSSYSGPYISSKAAALVKVETYLFTQKMNSSSFAKLQTSFDAHYQSGHDKLKALVDAEQEVFGN